MNGLLIVKNISREGPGLLQEVLKDHSLEFKIVDLEAGDTFPDPTQFKALVVLGGPDSANDKTTKMTNELDLVKNAIEAGIPYLGICLGMQVLVKAAGGQVVKAPTKEVGFMSADGEQFTVDITAAGKTDPLLKDLSDRLDVFHLHGETVRLTDQMILLATGKYCRNQIVKVADRAYGIQSHFELTTDMLSNWAANDPDLKVFDAHELQEELESISKSYDHIGLTLFTNFLKIADLI